MNNINYNKYIKYKNKFIKLKGGAVIPVIIFQEFHNATEVSNDIIKNFLENNIFKEYDPKNVLFVNEGMKKDKLFEQISNLPHNFKNSHFINENKVTRCEDYINIFCNFIEYFDHFIYKDIPLIISLNLDDESSLKLYRDTIRKSKINEYFAFINDNVINNKSNSNKMQTMMLNFFTEYASEYLFKRVKFKLYIEKFNELIKVIFELFIYALGEHNYCSDNTKLKEEIIKYSLLGDYEERKIQTHLITDITKGIRDEKLINKIENYICDNTNIKIIILLCGAGHFINLYNLINNCSLIKNHDVNTVISEHLISNGLKFNKMIPADSIRELTHVYEIMKTTLKINMSRTNTHILNHCSICNKTKYDHDHLIIFKCSCGTKAYCGKEHQKLDWAKHQKEFDHKALKK